MKKCFLLMLTLLCAGLHCVHGQTRILLTEAAQTEGAVCLDGSPAVYFLRTGSGEGAEKWILHLMGGGWCNSSESCRDSSITIMGSSRNWPEAIPLNGFLSSNPEVNPDFYNWNTVFFVYCDGGSFAGDREEPDDVGGTMIYYRGYRILQAIIRDLNEERGLSNATDVILTGCSAGGVSSLLHANFIQTLIPAAANYRVFPDAGYFIDVIDEESMSSVGRSLYTPLLELQNINEALIPACREDNNGSLWRCIISPVIYPYVQAPTFVVNSQFDNVYLNTLGICLPPNCNEEQETLFLLFQEAFDDMVEPVLSSRPENGYFLDSCYIHCQTRSNTPWTDFAIDGSSLRKAFGDWYFGRSTNTRLRDCTDPPCNPTCPEFESSAGRSLGNLYLVIAAFIGLFSIMI